MATTNLDFRKIDYDQLLDKPITRTSANVDTIKTAGVYDRGDGKRFLVSVDGNTITQIEESYNGYRTRTSTDGGLVRWAWTTTEFSDASAKRDVVVISGTEPVEKKETTAWIDTSDENKFKVYDGTDWMVISGQSIQTEEMPTASEELEGKIIQYEGVTTSTFTHGYFYECVGDGQNPETFSRINVQTQDSVEYTAGEGIEIINGTRVDYSAMRGPCDEWFHVPTKEEWESFIMDIVDDARTIHLPRSGKYNGDGSFSGFGGPYGSYWTSSTHSQNAIYLDIGFDYWLSINEDWAIERVNALPIRAFKDEPVIPDNTWIEVVTGKVWHNTGLWLISILVDTDTYVTIQDKNVGATEVWNSNEAVTSTNCGKFFQWWNNYGFEYGATLDTSSTKVDASTYWPSEYSSSTFITWDSDWSSVQNDDLWWWVTWPQTTTINNAITNIWVLSINWQTGHVAIDTGSQAEVMPTPSVENVGKIIQYTGDTNEYYTHAHFYEIIEDPNHPGTYIYQEVETQSVSADSVSYDNTDSGLTATNIQEAIDEIAPETIEVDDYSAVQWPCEDWFHIPSGAEFDNLLTITNAFNYDASDYISKLHFPLSWHWSADHTLSTSFTRYYKDQRAYLFTINNVVDGNNLETYKLLIDWRTNSVSCPLGPLDSSLSQIRAFKNEYVEPDSTWTVETGTLWGAGVFHNATLGLISITNGTDKFITIKDKNEGATTVYNSWDTMSESNAGKFFQWWNNYWFSFDMDWFDNYTQTQVNTTSYAPSTYSSNACFAHWYDIWMEPNNQNLWGGITGVQHITIKWYDSQNIVYNNSTSIFNSTNVQDVIDEISDKIESGSLGVTSYDDLTDTPTIKTQEQWYSWTTGGGIFYTKTLDVELTTPLYWEDTSTGDTHALKSNWHFTTIDKPNDYYEVDLDELGAWAAYPGMTPEPGDTVISIAPWYEHTFSIDGMTDTNITNVSNGQIMKYDSVSGKWINGNSEGWSLSKNYTLSSSDWADLKITLPSKNAMYTLTINTDSPTEYNCIVSTTNYSSMWEMGIEIEWLSNSSVKAYYTISSSGNVLYLTHLYASSFDSMSWTISLISNSVTQTEFDNIEIVMFDESEIPSGAIEIDLNPSEWWDDHEIVTQTQYDLLTPEQKAAKVYMIKGEGVAPTPGGGSAEDTSYDNTTSGLTATNVQDAIDEIAQGWSESSSVTFIEVWDSDLTYDSTNRRYNISSTKVTEIMTARGAWKNVVLCVTTNNQVMLLSNIWGGNYYVDFSWFREISSTGVKSWIGHIELDGSQGIRSAYIKMDQEFDTMTRMDFRMENAFYTYDSTLDRYIVKESFANDYRENVEYSGEYVIQLRNTAGRPIDTLQLVKREFSNGEYARYDICWRVKYDSANTAKQIHIHLEFDGSDNYLPSSSTYETKTIAYAS